MLVDLARLPVLPQQPAQHPLPPHPQHLRRHTCVGGTLPLTEATVATVATGQVQLAGARPGVGGDGLADDEAIGDQLAALK